MSSPSLQARGHIATLELEISALKEKVIEADRLQVRDALTVSPPSDPVSFP